MKRDFPLYSYNIYNYGDKVMSCLSYKIFEAFFILNAEGKCMYRSVGGK